MTPPANICVSSPSTSQQTEPGWRQWLTPGRRQWLKHSRIQSFWCPLSYRTGKFCFYQHRPSLRTRNRPTQVNLVFYILVYWILGLSNLRSTPKPIIHLDLSLGWGQGLAIIWWLNKAKDMETVMYWFCFLLRYWEPGISEVQGCHFQITLW